MNCTWYSQDFGDVVALLADKWFFWFWMGEPKWIFACFSAFGLLVVHIHPETKLAIKENPYNELCADFRRCFGKVGEFCFLEELHCVDQPHPIYIQELCRNIVFSQWLPSHIFMQLWHEWYLIFTTFWGCSGIVGWQVNFLVLGGWAVNTLCRSTAFCHWLVHSYIVFDIIREPSCNVGMRTACFKFLLFLFHV